MTRTYDLIAIGGGSGGLAMAQRAAQHGARSVVIESGRLGGTCVNVGCVPKKVMWHAAQLAHNIHDAGEYGFDVETRGFDWSALKEARDAYVARLNGIYERNLERREVTLIRGRARFTGARTVEVGGETLSAKHLVIATGGFPMIPDCPGADLGIDSDGFFELEEQPRRVVVVGSGYISVELAGVFRALGSEVTMLTRYDGLLRSFDPMLREELMDQMRASGIDIVMHAPVRSVSRAGDLTVLAEDGREFGGFDTLLWAAGRRANTKGLNLSEAGVETAAQGHVLTDEFQCTSAEGVYAIGDVTGRAELTPVAIAAGRRLADRIFGGMSESKLSYECIPSVIFSHPPIGSVGMTEVEAHARHGDETRVYQARFVPLFHQLGESRPHTAMKLVTVGEEERVVGCHIIGPGADEMLQGFAVAIRMGARKADFDATIAIHPTSAEELVTLT